MFLYWKNVPKCKDRWQCELEEAIVKYHVEETVTGKQELSGHMKA